MMESVDAIDKATGTAVRAVSAILPDIVREMFGPEAIYATLKKEQKNLLSIKTSGLVYQQTLRNLNQAKG